MFIPTAVRAVFCCLVGFTIATVAAADHYPSFQDAVVRTRVGLSFQADVRKELCVTDGQVATIETALKPIALKYQDGVRKLSGLDPSAAQAAYNTLVKDVVAAAVKAVDGALKPEQAKRLRQIELQQLGPAAYTESDVRQALGLTDIQLKKLRDISDEYERKSNRLKRTASGAQPYRTIPGTDLPRAGEDTMAGVTPVMLRREHALAAKNVLTPEQVNRWYDLVGKPFPAK